MPDRIRCCGIAFSPCRIRCCGIAFSRGCPHARVLVERHGRTKRRLSRSYNLLWSITPGAASSGAHDAAYLLLEL